MGDPRPACCACVLMIAAMAVQPAVARAECNAEDAEGRSNAIRRHLDQQASRARWWDVGWGVGLGVAGLGQVGLIAAEWAPGRDYDDDVEAGLIVGASQSAIGSLSHVILPLKIARPPAPTGDACVDEENAMKALRETAGHQREAFYLNHVGNAALAVGGLLVLGLAFDTWEEGVSGMVVSYVVGLATTYTQPRGSWKALRRGTFENPLAEQPTLRSLRVTPVRGRDFAGLALTGRF